MAWLAISETHISTSSADTLIVSTIFLEKRIYLALLTLPLGLGLELGALSLLLSLNFCTRALDEDGATAEDFWQN